MAMFHVGQKVEYIGEDYRCGPTEAARCTELPVPGAVYTIREARSPRLYLLAEIRIHHPKFNDIEVPVDDFLLRPVVDGKTETDISIFQEILRKHSKPAPVSLEPFPSTAWNG